MLDQTNTYKYVWVSMYMLLKNLTIDLKRKIGSFLIVKDCLTMDMVWKEKCYDKWLYMLRWKNETVYHKTKIHYIITTYVNQRYKTQFFFTNGKVKNKPTFYIFDPLSTSTRQAATKNIKLIYGTREYQQVYK